MALDMTHRRKKYKNYVDELQKKKNTTKSRVRAKVEHVFRVLKRQFGFADSLALSLVSAVAPDFLLLAS